MTGSNAMSSASAGGTDRTTRGARTVTPSAVTTTWSGCWLIGADGGAEVDGLPEVRRHPRRHGAGTTIHEVLLRAVLDREERLQAVVPPHEHQQVQQRDVVEVPCVQPAHRHLEEIAGQPGADAGGLEVLADRLVVPLGRPLGRPRCLERHVLRASVDPPLRQGDRGDGQRADLRDEPGVPVGLVPTHQQVRTGDVGLVGRHPGLGGQRERRVVPGTEPPTAAVDGDVSTPGPGEALRPDAPTDAVAGLHDDDRLPRLGEAPGGRQPGVARADDADIGVHPHGHGGER